MKLDIKDSDQLPKALDMVEGVSVCRLTESGDGEFHVEWGTLTDVQQAKLVALHDRLNATIAEVDSDVMEVLGLSQYSGIAA